MDWFHVFIICGIFLVSSSIFSDFFLWSSRKLSINPWYFNFKIGKVDSKDVRLSGNPVADPATGGLPRFIIIARLCNIQIDFVYIKIYVIFIGHH